MRNFEQCVVLLHVPVPEDGGDELLQRHAEGDGPALPDDQVTLHVGDRRARR